MMKALTGITGLFLIVLLMIIPAGAYSVFAEGVNCVQGDPYCACTATSCNSPANVGTPNGLVGDFTSEMALPGPKGQNGWLHTENYGANSRETHWNENKVSYLEKADFGFYAGHGNEGLFTFCEKDPGKTEYNFFASSQPSWGSGGSLRWVVLHSCQTLKSTSANKENWKNLIKKTGTSGIHLIMGFDSDAKEKNTETIKFVDLMKGLASETHSTPWTIYYSWVYALQNCINEQTTVGAIVYDSPTSNDYLPGYGTVQTPQRQNIIYTNFYCTPPGVLGGAYGLSPAVSPVIDGKNILNATLPDVPASITVYTPVSAQMTLSDVKNLADNLGLNGEVWENEEFFGITSEKFLFIVGKESGHIYYSDMKRSRPNGKDIPGNLPSDEEATKYAITFLKNAQILPGDLSAIRTLHQNATDITDSDNSFVSWEDVQVYFQRQIDGYDVMGSRFSVDVGADGDIIGLNTNWRNYAPYKKFPLKTPEQAYKEFKQTHLHAHEEPDSVSVDRITLVYYTQPAAEQEKYLQPAYLFEGHFRNGDKTSGFGHVYIPATDVVLDTLPE